MTIKLGVVMDPIALIKPKKDSTLAMLIEAQRRGWPIHYMELKDLFVRDSKGYAFTTPLQVNDDLQSWFSFGIRQLIALEQLDVILMRKDPPWTLNYIYCTYLLELAEQAGVLVINKPQSLRDANEKLFTTWFPQCCPPTLITSNKKLLLDFVAQYKEVIFKPLDSMGGQSVFLIRTGDLNTNVVIETLTHRGKRLIMAQQFIPAIMQGDKRILMINGEPIEYALARIPAEGDIRGNLVANARGDVIPLTENDRFICSQVGPILRQKGLAFVGLDVIGNYLTEINVTSPTCIREIEAVYPLNIAGRLLDHIENTLATK
jgi:glutathione synthase